MVRNQLAAQVVNMRLLRRLSGVHNWGGSDRNAAHSVEDCHFWKNWTRGGTGACRCRVTSTRRHRQIPRWRQHRATTGGINLHPLAWYGSPCALCLAIDAFFPSESLLFEPQASPLHRLATRVKVFRCLLTGNWVCSGLLEFIRYVLPVKAPFIPF